MPLRRCIDLQHVDLLLAVFDKRVHAHDLLLARFDGVLILVAGVGDFGLRESALDGGDHATLVIDARDVLAGARLHLRVRLSMK